jgi:hypothetical protein
MDIETELGIEWDCQKLLRQYYHYVDQREYEKATATTYCTFYYTEGARIEDQVEPLEFEGPHRTSDGYVELVRAPDGWKIAKRRSRLIFRRNPGEPVTLEKWSKAANKAT